MGTNYYGGLSADAASRLGGFKGNADSMQRGHNDQYDAFRHAYVSALGSYLAKVLGDKKGR